MTVLPILTWPHPRLSAVCAPVEAITASVRALGRDLLETMYAAPGRGLAAPQVGVLSRMFVMDPQWKEGTPTPQVCINPDIIERGPDQTISDEGCLSLPGVTVPVRRCTAVKMVWTDLDGVVHDDALTGFAALCAQHELDHLDGILTLDRVSAAERAEILSRYPGAPGPPH